MTEQEYRTKAELIKQESLDKWIAPETIKRRKDAETWLKNTGCKFCSFCHAFKTENNFTCLVGRFCPVHDGEDDICCNAFYNMDCLFENDYHMYSSATVKKFRANCAVMKAQIASISIETIIEALKQYEQFIEEE